MNNGKVRIYELSKELDLDNKELLEICTQLNIAVKSHSSTITETQAERIRRAAKKPVAPTGRTKVSPAANDDGVNAANDSGPLKGKRKQQILALHKQKPRSPSLSDQSEPTLAAPPRPMRPQPPTPPKPSEDSASPLIEPPRPPEAEERQTLEETTTTQFESPQLIKPPARPQENNQVEKPIKPQPITQAATLVQRNTSEVDVEQPEVIKKPLKLQRPKQQKSVVESSPQLDQAPLTPSEPEEDGIEEEVLLDPPERPKQKLKRPIPARPAKKGAWEDEEEDTETDKAGKAAKVSKSKRRPQILDDDEDFESGLGTSATPAVANLSVARPPKPKQLVEAIPAPSAKKAQKTQTKPDSSVAKTRAERRNKKEETKRPEKIVLNGNLTVRELSDLLGVSETEIITKLFLKGIAVNITQTLDFDTARLVAEEFGVAAETAEKTSAAAKATEMLDAEDLENLQRRPPVVTIMGHVDHGKTTLLDSIRKTKVAQGEAGGITQHIGAYHVDIDHEDRHEQIVFLDTPGHEAFTAMRARGTRVTDIAILVVAADDGVQPQTREAISHARAAEVPIVVAINKVDKPGAEADRVKQELTELNLVPEEWGGETIMVPVSALKGENLETLLEMILLVAELEELSANPNRAAKGTVIEANLDRARGPVATLLVQNGSLRVGDVIVAGSVFGKIRAMIDDQGKKVEAATPSFAVEVLGLNEVPAAGDEFDVLPSEKEARALADERAVEQRRSRLQQAMASRRVTLTSLSAQAQEGELKELNLVLKADVQGSVEAILGALNQLPQGEVQIRVLLAAPGEITETDVDLAAASGAVVVGFNTTLASGSRQAADQEGVDIREYNVIYKLLDEIQGAMEGLLEPEAVEEHLGFAQVRAVFPVGRGTVAGCYVQSGKIVRNRLLRVRRNDQVVYEGTIDSLKRVKEDVREVNAGYECGINSAKFNEWQEGDIIEAYEMVMKRRTLSS